MDRSKFFIIGAVGIALLHIPLLAHMSLDPSLVIEIEPRRPGRLQSDLLLTLEPLVLRPECPSLDAFAFHEVLKEPGSEEKGEKVLFFLPESREPHLALLPAKIPLQFVKGKLALDGQEQGQFFLTLKKKKKGYLLGELVLVWEGKKHTVSGLIPINSPFITPLPAAASSLVYHGVHQIDQMQKAKGQRHVVTWEGKTLFVADGALLSSPFATVAFRLAEGAMVDVWEGGHFSRSQLAEVEKRRGAIPSVERGRLLVPGKAHILVEGTSLVVKEGDWLVQEGGKWKVVRAQKGKNKLKDALVPLLFIGAIEEEGRSGLLQTHYITAEKDRAYPIDVPLLIEKGRGE